MEMLDKVAPLKPEALADENVEEDGDKASFVFREAVLNRSERIAGYEFSLHRRLHSRFAAQRSMVRRVYDDLLVRSLASFNVEQLLGHRLAFVDIAAVSLDNVQLDGLPRANTVLLLDLTEELARAPDVLTAQLASIGARNFKVGCRLRPQSAALLPEVVAHGDFLQLFRSDFSAPQMANLLSRAAQCTRSAPGALGTMAADIELFDDFKLCFDAGFDFFQGPFVTSRETWERAPVEHDHSRLIQLLNELHGGAQAEVLTGLVRTHPNLISKLLRLASAPALGGAQAFTTLEEALDHLGRERFYRVALLLLFDVRGGNGGERDVIEQALARARLLERLGVQTGAGPSRVNALFIAGALSLAEPILGQPLDVVLTRVAVTPEVQRALIGDGGPLGNLVKLALACEAGEIEEIRKYAGLCGIAQERANHELLDALIWAQEAAELVR